MKLIEIADEFAEPTTKGLSAQERLDRAEQQMRGLEHQQDALREIMLKLDKQVKDKVGPQNSHFTYSHKDDTGPGKTSVPWATKGWGQYKTYFIDPSDPLAKHAIKAAKRRFDVVTLIDKLKGKITSLKRETQKQAGTYISRDDMDNFAMAAMKDFITLLKGNVYDHTYEVRPNSSRTKKNGVTRLYISVKSYNKDLMYGQWRDKAVDAKDALKARLTQNGFTGTRVAFSDNSEPNTKVYSGFLELSVKTSDIVDVYKK